MGRIRQGNQVPHPHASETHGKKTSLTVTPACNVSFVDLLMFPSDILGGGVWREFMQSLYVALHGTFGSYFLRVALREGQLWQFAYLE
jgi:hypothetical protein